jgi:hypothetical protein
MGKEYISEGSNSSASNDPRHKDPTVLTPK